jgi:hypothetical protein
MSEGPTIVQHIMGRPYRVHDDGFARSYVAGYQRFMNDHPDPKKPVGDGYIYGFIFKNICDPLNSNYENAGYIIGWIAALLKQVPESQTGPLVAEVATMQLHLIGLAHDRRCSCGHLLRSAREQVEGYCMECRLTCLLHPVRKEKETDGAIIS